MSKEMLEERKKSLKHGFEKMIEYVEGVKYLNKKKDNINLFITKFRCRHGMLASYFGETIKPCGVNCDYCRNSEKVKKMIHQLNLGTYEKGAKTTWSSLKKDKNEDTELYDGGRKR